MATSSATPLSEADAEQDFIHQLAIEVSDRKQLLYDDIMTTLMLSHRNQMSRLTNAINPNDLLARRLIEIAKGNRTGEAFIKGA